MVVIIPVLRRLRQEDREFKANLSYIKWNKTIVKWLGAGGSCL
jgi:hypothetical protein